MYIVITVHAVFLPSPADYSGPDTITYFRGPNLQVGKCYGGLQKNDICKM